MMRDAIDTRAAVPLCQDHGTRIGTVTCLFYNGQGQLRVEAEVDAEWCELTKKSLHHFSISARPISKRLENGVWCVDKAELAEVSLTGNPKDINCKVTGRRESDILRLRQRKSAVTADLLTEQLRLIELRIPNLKPEHLGVQEKSAASVTRPLMMQGGEFAAYEREE